MAGVRDGFLTGKGVKDATKGGRTIRVGDGGSGERIIDLNEKLIDAPNQELSITLYMENTTTVPSDEVVDIPVVDAPPHDENPNPPIIQQPLRSLSEIQLEHEKEDELVAVVVKVTLGRSGGESFWEEGDDFGMDVLRFHTCLTDILGFLEKLEWWFEQDIDDEGEGDKEGEGGSKTTCDGHDAHIENLPKSRRLKNDVRGSLLLDRR
nr:hypothetical protein [Tanacetum cinerariifolium]